MYRYRSGCDSCTFVWDQCETRSGRMRNGRAYAAERSLSVRASNEPAVLGVEPTWDIAKLFPDQGAWSEEEYLMLPGNRLVEFSHGIVEVLPMPSYAHQLMVAWLYELLREFIVHRKLGRVIFAPLRVRLWAGKYREPDLMVMLEENRHRILQQYWDGADLVMEIVSPDDPCTRFGDQAS